MEEDIRILKENIKNGYIYINCGYTINNALGNLLNVFEKTQKENEELQIIKSGIQVLQTHYANDNTYIIAKRDFINGDYKHLLDDYIPKSKIREMVEKLKNKVIPRRADGKSTETMINLLKLWVLEELLGGEK